MKRHSELLSLEGKVALVTGGAVNIGKAIAEKLAEAGADVAVTYFADKDAAYRLHSKLENDGLNCLCLMADLRNEADAVSVVYTVCEHFGKVDVLVNNAGVFGLSWQHELSSVDFDAVFDLNMRGLFIVTREVLKSMFKLGGGSIVNIASINGLHPGFGKTAHYDATKGAVIAYTRSLAAEVGTKNIRVNSVAPGLVDSENLRKLAAELAKDVERRTPLKKIARAEDIANAVLFLASEAASHITGETLVVDGGYLMT